MVSYNIMAKVRSKYDLRLGLNAPNLRRDDAIKGTSNMKRDILNGAKSSRR